MLTNVFILGQISDVISDNLRYLEVERPYKENSGHFSTDKIPVVFWKRIPKDYFMTLKLGTYVAIRGRLETMEKIGVVIVADYVEFLGGRPAEVLGPTPKLI